MDNLNIFDGIEIAIKSKLSIISKNLGEGFSLKTNDNMSILILTDKENFGIRKKHRYNSLSILPQSTTSLDLFEKNDFVVHIDHGIGRYNGTTILDETGRAIIYKDNKVIADLKNIKTLADTCTGGYMKMGIYRHRTINYWTSDWES